MTDLEEILEQLEEAIEDEDDDAIEELGSSLMKLDIDMKELVLEKLAEAVIEGEDEIAEGWGKIAIQAGVDAYDAIVNGLASGMSIMGERYENGEVFVPNLLISAGAMYSGMEILSPHMNLEGGSKPATVVIGTVEGDVHDIGKNLVKTMMTASGFTMIDLGNDVKLENFIETARENKADAISISTLMTTTMPGMPKAIEMLQENGFRDSLAVMVGGAPISEEFAKKIGADGTAIDASSAVDTLKDLLGSMPSNEERWSDQNIAVSKEKWAQILADKEDVGEEIDITLVTSEKIMEEFDEVAIKARSKMTHTERCFAALGDKKVDHLPVYPLACGGLRKFAGYTYYEYATDAKAFANTAVAGVKYMDLDMFAGLIDLSVTAGDLGCEIKYNEEDTAQAAGHLKEYEDIEIPDKLGSRASVLVEGTKMAREKVNKECEAPVMAFHEGPLLTLTQLIGATKVLGDINTRPDEVIAATHQCMEYVGLLTNTFFENDTCDGLVIDNLWSNNILLSEEQYWKFDGQIVYDKHIPIFNQYNQPYLVHNCADAPHFNVQIKKFGAPLFSYAFYPGEVDKGSRDYASLIPEYGETCCMMGQIDPIHFINNDPEDFARIRNETVDLTEGVLNTLKEMGLQSKYVLSSGCEVPPAGPQDIVKSMIDVARTEGADIYKKIIG